MLFHQRSWLTSSLPPFVLSLLVIWVALFNLANEPEDVKTEPDQEGSYMYM